MYSSVFCFCLRATVISPPLHLPLDIQFHGTHTHRAIYSALRKKKGTALTSFKADTLDMDYIDLAVPNMKALKMM